MILTLNRLMVSDKTSIEEVHMGCYNSTVVRANIDQVWALFSNFHDMSWAEGVITKTEPVGDVSGAEVGARRILNDAFHETLRVVDDENRTIEYSIDDGPDAVSKDNVQGYIGKVRLLPVTDEGATFVEWSSSWASGGEGTTEFCDPIYRALLGALKNHLAR
jgi:hypothetical protein